MELVLTRVHRDSEVELRKRRRCAISTPSTESIVARKDEISDLITPEQGQHGTDYGADGSGAARS